MISDKLAFTARKKAIKCLMYQDEFSAAIEEYEALRDEADEIEALFIDIDILRAEEMLDAANGVDAIGTRDEQIYALHNRIDELAAGRAERLWQSSIVTEFELSPVYPNPFNSTTRITFAIPEADLVKLSVYDIAGREVTASSRYFTAGRHSLSWQADQYSAGTYFLKLEANGQVKTQKMLLLK